MSRASGVTLGLPPGMVSLSLGTEGDAGLSNNKKSNGKSQNIGVWHMLRDVLVGSMNKGQFPFAVCALIFIVMILRMPAADVSRLMFHLTDLAERGQIVGWILAVVELGAWFVHSRRQRRLITSEMRRMARVRDEHQARSIGAGRVKSSEARR